MKMSFESLCKRLSDERKRIVASQPYDAKKPPNGGKLGELFDDACVVRVLRQHILANGAIVVGGMTIGLGSGARGALISTDPARFRQLLNQLRKTTMDGIGKEIYEKWRQKSRVRVPETLAGGRKFEGFD